MKKQLLLLVMILLPLIASADDGGICGDNVTYTYVESTHTLIISGTGTMADYNMENSKVPWYSYRSEIVKAIIEDGVTSIGDYAFCSCECLTSITIPSSVTSIGAVAFEFCYGLTSITIPYGVTNIGSSTFYGCSSLTSVTIPNSVTSIEDYAFAGCNSLTSITIPNSVTSIKSGAFSWCSGLTSITIPYGVTNIGNYTFNGCRGLTSITIPDGVTSIGNDAFCFCEGLTSITIPNSVMSIGDNAFSRCSGLLSITIPNDVTSIGNHTFSMCSSLISITIPNSVTRIGDYAFSACSSLTSITIPSNVTSLGDGAFINCSGLASITIPNSVTSIGNEAFSACSSLTSIIIPNRVTSIKYGAFYECSSLTSVTISDGVTSIGDNAFAYCRSLTSVTIPNSVTSIGESSFSYCYSIKNITLPENIKIIKRSTFQDCSSLTSLTIPTSVEFIYQEAFARCNNLEYVKALPETPPFLYDNSFSNFSVPLKVPKGCKEAYQTAQGWKNFTYITDTEKYRLTYMIDNEEYKSYEIEEGATITTEPAPTKEGYTFSGWSEIPEIMPAHDVIVTGSFTVNQYKLIYVVDGQQYKSLTLNYGEKITPEANPEKEGYTFSGWSEIPATMPAHDVTVTGTFTVNKYKLTYMVDGQVYKATEVDYGTALTPEPTPTKEGYTFSGWSEIPSTMPAHDVTVTGTFTVNKYQLTYIVDGEEYKTYEVEYGTTITPEQEPVKEGFVFSGWNGLPETMPAHVVIVTGTFTKAKYMLTYMVDGEVYKSQEMDYGTTITPEPAPTKEGHTFSGWSEIPATMPAHDVTVTGSFSVNKYILTYILDGKEYKTIELEYGTTITPEPNPEKEGYTFSGWSEIPETMPAHIVIITGSFTINSYTLTYMIDDKVYKQMMYEYGATIIPEPKPAGDYVSFEWVGEPETMPAQDVTVTAVYETGIAEIMMMVQQGQVRIYSPNGKKLDKLQKGLNIVVMQDGTTRKVVVK